jgi:hypothetical protein
MAIRTFLDYQDSWSTVVPAVLVLAVLLIGGTTLVCAFVCCAEPRKCDKKTDAAAGAEAELVVGARCRVTSQALLRMAAELDGPEPDSTVGARTHLEAGMVIRVLELKVVGRRHEAAARTVAELAAKKAAAVEAEDFPLAITLKAECAEAEKRLATRMARVAIGGRVI